MIATRQAGRAGRPAVLRHLRRRSRRLRARARLRQVNLRRTEMALRQPRPAPPPASASASCNPASCEVVYGAPRTLLFVTVKRDNPSWRDLYGHWWLEVDEDSYGWWPRAVPIGVWQLMTGTRGVLNGVGLLGRSGTWQRDAQHGHSAAHEFHPVLVLPLTDEQVRTRLREFAGHYRGAWRWAWTSRTQPDTCRSFQDALMRAAGLREGVEHLASRGKGCPLLYRPRTLLWWAQDQRSENLVRAGRVLGRIGQPGQRRSHTGQFSLLTGGAHGRFGRAAHPDDPPGNKAQQS